MNIRGIAAPFDALGNPCGFPTTIAPGALRPTFPCALVPQHVGDDSDNLASTIDGSMRVWSAPTALCFEARVSERVHDAIRWKAPLKCSVMMLVDREVEVIEAGEVRRRILKARVEHIGLTYDPGFSSTGVWSAEDDLDDLPESIRSIARRWALIDGEIGAAPEHVGRGHRSNIVSPKHGNSPTYALRRLKRDRPDDLDRLIEDGRHAMAPALAWLAERGANRPRATAGGRGTRPRIAPR